MPAAFADERMLSWSSLRLTSYCCISNPTIEVSSLAKSVCVMPYLAFLSANPASLTITSGFLQASGFGSNVVVVLSMTSEKIRYF
jgi:hypothetical protein